MKRVFLFNMMTLDGFFEGPNREIDWHNVDDEFNEFAIAQLHEIDTLLFGRVTYQLMASYWPTQEAIQSDPIVAGLMNSMPKVVFSRTLRKVEWNNTTLVSENSFAEISRLKQHSGKDLAVFGSANFAMTLILHNLIDEFRIMVNPLVLGKGKPLFEGANGRLDLKLLKARTFRSGNVLLYYGSDKK